MEIRITRLTGWDQVLTTARATVWKSRLDKDPSDKFKEEICQSEHSPLRSLRYYVEIVGIKYWVAMHLVRHHVGFEPFVSTQRGDRIDLEVPRDQKGQGDLVNLAFEVNAQSLINISRARICKMAHEETRGVWWKVISSLKKIEPILAKYCVPHCVYRGLCPEPVGRQSCTLNWKPWRQKYERFFL